MDPLTKRRHDLTEVIPPGPNAAREAEKARTRLLNQVDERRNPRTRATVNQLLDRWLEVLDVEPSTRRGYVLKMDKHIRPMLGSVQVGRVDAELLETFYARLRKCRDHCDGRRYVQHRTQRPHECDERCGRHACKGLAASTIRQIHWILSGALDRAVRWKWIALNPAEQAAKPALPHPDPKPPTAAEASRIVTEAWRDPDWGTFVWCAMTLGARRGELCALRWQHVDLDNSVVTLRRAISVGEDGELVEKDTKTHQQRRAVIDSDTADVLAEHKRRWEQRAEALSIELSPAAFVFSAAPDGSTFPVPDTMTQRYDRLAKRLGIDSHLHTLRHYSATELITAGTDIRTVAGRLGHGGGGATTLRVYAAWLSEADQRAASVLSGRMPPRPVVKFGDQSLKTRPPQRPSVSRTARHAALEWWHSARLAGKLPTGADIARAAGVDSSVGRRWRREWLAAEGIASDYEMPQQ
ncbi:tyrosine-type recombinase/integrase [Nucisporomicrobium flavum]|uniref:tyrosine-type recombinase/integrase n=1 Tax=Nucisporomicrobium flavum TaxID=2785915 RepID=UPI0027DC7455|nr:tyrosine-type recombinase/integrase [Nucisporomicrobium flavum]